MNAATEKRASSSHLTLRRVAVGALIMLLGLTSVFGLASAAHAGDSDEVEGLTFYDVSASLMGVFSTAQQPDDDSVEWSDPGWDTILQNPGSAGSFLGYSDPGWGISQLSGSSNTMSYDSLSVRGTDGDGNASEPAGQGFQEFALFGATLNGLGLDDTRTGLSLNIGSWLGGGIMLLLFLLTYAVDFLFRAMLSVLSFLNPFRLFDEAIRNTVGDAYTTGSDELPGFLSGLSSWIAGWYGFLDAMAWQAMAPLFIALFLVGIVFFKKLDKGSALKKLVIRLMFMGLGLPLMGSMFTATLDTMNDGFSAGRTGGAQVIASTYVDLEGWAHNGRLAVPVDGATIEWDKTNGRPSGDSLRNVRETALAINNQTHGFGLERVVGTDDPAAWSQAAIESDDTNVEEADFGTITDMLQRNMSGSQITASAYETGAISWWSSRMDSPETVVDWFRNITGGSYATSASDELWANIAQRAQFWSESGGTYNAEVLAGNPVVSVGEKPVGLQAREDGDGVLAFRTVRDNIAEDDQCGTSFGSLHGAPANCNMSTLAMFNYLNTGFGENEITQYGSSNVMSEATREMHTSVNLVGTGTMSLLYWLNAALLLGAFVVLGFTFAFAMVFGALKRAFQTIAAIPFATLGALHGIAKVIIYSFAAILEVFMTIFLYIFVIEMLLSLPQIIEAPLSAILNDDGEVANVAGAMAFIAFLVGGPALTMVMTFVSIIALIAFTVTALKTRKVVIKAADEAVTKLVEKFLDVNAQPASAGTGSGLGQGIAAGAGAGLGAVGGNRLMRGGFSTGSTPNVSGTNKPDELSSGPEKPSNWRGGGMGGGTKAMGVGGTTGLLERGKGSGGSDDPNGPNGPTRHHDSMGYASDDQKFGEQVRVSGLSMDGQGYGREDRDGANGSTSTTSTSEERARTTSDERSASDRAAVRETSTNEASGRQISTEDTRNRQDPVAIPTHNPEPSPEGQRTSEDQRNSEKEIEKARSNEQNTAHENDAVTTSTDRGATNLGGNNSSLSERERMEAQAASERNNSTETASAESDSQAQRDQDSEQSASSNRELQAGENQHREPSQAIATEQSQDRSSQSERADRDVSTSRGQSTEAAASEQNSQTEARSIAGASVENNSTEAKVKQDGSQEKVHQDNRADQKNFEEQNVEQDNSSEQTVDPKKVDTSDTKPETGPKSSGAAGAAAAGTGVGVAAAKSQKDSGVRGTATPAEKKVGARSASTPAKPRKAPAPSTVKKGGSAPSTTPASTVKKTQSTKTPTRGSEARKSALGGAVKGGASGAVLGAAKGAATGVAGGLPGIGAGAARGAAVGGAKGAAAGGAVGGAKGAVKKQSTPAQPPKKVAAPSTPTAQPNTKRARGVSSRSVPQVGQPPKGIKPGPRAAAAAENRTPRASAGGTNSAPRIDDATSKKGGPKQPPRQ